MRITVGILVFAAAAAVAGCGGDPQLGIVSPYGEGYSDGCDSGYSDLGLASFEYTSGGSFFGGDYGDGWSEGYSDCQEFMRAAAL